MAIPRVCSIPDCDKGVVARNLCSKHYQRLAKYGDPLGGRPTPALQFYKDVVLTYEGNDCLIWPFATHPAGYGKVKIDGQTLVVSRIVCEAVHGNPPTPSHHAAHSCGKGHLGCVSPRHLSWKTPTENSADKFIHGTQPLGARNVRAKLTEADVLAIRSDPRDAPIIALEYGVARNSIHRIRSRATWRHI